MKCRICPEHKVRSKNYSVVVEIDEAEENVLEAQCQDCVAAEGKCFVTYIKVGSTPFYLLQVVVNMQWLS